MRPCEAAHIEHPRVGRLNAGELSLIKLLAGADSVASWLVADGDDTVPAALPLRDDGGQLFRTRPALGDAQPRRSQPTEL